jgi:hypothetical protein
LTPALQSAPAVVALPREIDRLSAGALAVLAPWPAARSTLTLLQFLLGPANPTLSGHRLLGILDPTDEFVAGKRRDVLPRIECGGVGHQRFAQVNRKLVHRPTGHSFDAHTVKVAGASEPGDDRHLLRVATIRRPPSANLFDRVRRRGSRTRPDIVASVSDTEPSAGRTWSYRFSRPGNVEIEICDLHGDGAAEAHARELSTSQHTPVIVHRHDHVDWEYIIEVDEQRWS